MTRDIDVKTATAIIEMVRRSLAERVPHDQIESNLLECYGINKIRKCEGAAHSNPFIDNCGVCAPRWGWAGESVVVKGRMPKKKPEEIA